MLTGKQQESLSINIPTLHCTYAVHAAGSRSEGKQLCHRETPFVDSLDWLHHWIIS